jgi:hypothetical protein
LSLSSSWCVSSRKSSLAWLDVKSLVSRQADKLAIAMPRGMINQVTLSSSDSQMPTERLLSMNSSSRSSQWLMQMGEGWLVLLILGTAGVILREHGAC